MSENEKTLLEMAAGQVRALELGPRIKGLRKNKRMTLKNLSYETNLSMSTLSQVENGLVIPPLKSLALISRALGVELGYWFLGDGFRGYKKKQAINDAAEKILSIAAEVKILSE